jgi:hypothetical protein
MIVEANLELIEDSLSAKNIEADSKPFRKSNGRHNFKFPNAQFEITHTFSSRMVMGIIGIE